MDFGAFTATEAGAVVVLYALVVGVAIYRELTWGHFVAALEHSVQDIGMVMLIIIMAAALGHVVDTGVVGAYQRSDRLAKRRVLLEQWEQFLTAAN